MKDTRGMKWASEGCYKALRSLVDAVNGPSNEAYVFSRCEENKPIIEEAERALSYYDWHGIGGEKNTKEVAE